jgi:hypothetical protein
MNTIKERLDRIIKVDNALETGLRLPVINLAGWKKLKEERNSLVQGILLQSRRESKS